MEIITGLIAAYTLTAGVYLLFFAIASFFYKNESAKSGVDNRIAVMLPVYKADDVVLQSARQALDLRYDKTKFDVIVIADSLHASTMSLLSNMGCIVIRMCLTPRSKAKALNLALKALPDAYDICVVLDADNYLANDALEQINAAFNHGHYAIQCKRVAKEITSPVSVLDAISEGINNNIFRKGHAAAGLSAALAGSGMAFDYQLFKEAMSEIKATNGFDKDLEFEIISRNIRIAYLDSVEVFDEKVASLDVLQKQRTRWFAAQIINIRKGFRFAKKNPTIDVLDKWWQMFLPSRLLLVVFMYLATAIAFLVSGPVITINFLAAAAATTLAMILTTPRHYISGRLWSVVLYLPKAVLALCISMLSIHKARKGFIHTPHQAAQQKNIL